MKKIFKILSVSTLTSLPVISVANLANNEISKPNSLDIDYLNSLNENQNLDMETYGDLTRPLNINLDIWAIGKVWGTGAHKIAKRNDNGSVKIYYSDYGGWDGFISRFKWITVSFVYQYNFQSGRNFNWDTYYREREMVPDSILFDLSNYVKLGEWTTIKSANSNKGGYDWGNYYKTEMRVDNINNINLEIKLKYEVAAYGVGNNWYWSAGFVNTSSVTITERNNF